MFVIKNLCMYKVQFSINLAPSVRVTGIFHRERNLSKIAPRKYAPGMSKTTTSRSSYASTSSVARIASKKCWVYYELKTNPIRPGSKNHDKPMKSPDGGSRNCVVCSKGNRWICLGCTIDLGENFPVCPIEKRPECFANMHRIQTEI